MARNVRLSRLNPVYLAYRHAGGFMLFLALGIAGGLVVQAVATPRTYESDFRRSFAVIPTMAAAGYDWNGKLREWSGILADRDQRVLLTANLRAAVKRAAFPPQAVSEDLSGRLREELLAFRTPRSYSTSPKTGGFRPYFGPEVEIARHDIAANLDFQSLARLVCDLDPRPGVTGWDFEEAGRYIAGLTASDRLVISPGPEDPHFAVFYRLHRLLNDNVAANSPAEAWLTAVEEVEARIAREFEFDGGGGFGPDARRELAAELAAIPVLVANNLYFMAGALYGDDDDAKSEEELWDSRWLSDTRLRLDHDGAARGRLGCIMQAQLHPFSFPVDSPMTRITPLAVRTLLAFIEVREKALEKNRRVEPIAPPAAAAAVAEPAVPADPGQNEQDLLAEKEALKAAAREREALLAELAEAVFQARVRRDEAGRHLDAARIAADQLAAEALAAQERADRLKERLEAAEAVAAMRGEPEPDPARLCLEEEREALLRYIALLLQSCTDEHPFVVQARRELAVVDGRLALLPPCADTTDDEQDRTRLLNARAEWTAAANNAAGLAERLKRRRADAEKRLAEFSNAERNLAEREFALTSERAKSISAPQSPVQEINQNIEKIADRLAAITTDRLAAESAKVEITPAQPEPPPLPDAVVSFSSLPDTIPLARLAPTALPVYVGAALGLCLGLLYVILREALSFRLTDAFMARRLVDLPLLAVLPAYDGKSLADAAKIDGGKLLARDNRKTYVPDDVEKHDPSPLGKRKAVRLRVRKRRYAVWVVAGVVLLLGLALHQAVAQGWLTPAPPFASEVWRRSPPSWTSPAYVEDEDL